MANPVNWLKADRPYAGPTRRARVWDEAKQAYVTPVYEKGHPQAGRPVRERLPSIGWDNEPSRATPNKTTVKKRHTQWLRTDGHEVFVVLTNASAHVPDSDTSCETDRRLKAKYFGWIEQGKCPCALLLAGELQPESIAADSSTWHRACDPRDLGGDNPPCPHYLAEKKARQGRRVDENSAQVAKYATEAEKHADAVREMKAAVVEAVAGAAAAARQVDAPAPAPTGGKSK